MILRQIGSGVARLVEKHNHTRTYPDPAASTIRRAENYKRFRPQRGNKNEAQNRPAVVTD